MNNRPEMTRTTNVERSNTGDHCAASARLAGYRGPYNHPVQPTTKTYTMQRTIPYHNAAQA